MAFQPVDLSRWDRREYFEHYMQAVPCTWSMTVPLDVTELGDTPLYPALLWAITGAVNALPEFRTAVKDGEVGIYDDMHPAYTVLDKESKRFSAIWTPYSADFSAFLANYRQDVAQYGSSGRLFPKEGQPDNCFDVSMAPWLDFTAFHLNLYDSRSYTLPIFTLGKAAMRDGRRILPLALQVHHAVCDGWHAGLFVEHLRKILQQTDWRNAK